MKVIPKEQIERQKLTQQEVILLHLLYNGFITNKDCNECYGFRHLPSIIRDLKENWLVTFSTIKQKSLNRYKQKTDFVEYHITNPQLYRGLIG